MALRFTSQSHLSTVEREMPNQPNSKLLLKGAKEQKRELIHMDVSETPELQKPHFYNWNNQLL